MTMSSLVSGLPLQYNSLRTMKTLTVLVPVALLAAAPSFAQFDLSGQWTPQTHEDQPERGPGPELGDYLGLPINAESRLRAESWDPSRLTLQEHQCRVHISPYIYRGPLEVRMWNEVDPETQQLIAIKNYISTYEQTRTIWMDGRPHPPAYAKHTWMGFSTGKWEGDMLTVNTTHIKTGWVRRNGVPESDQATMVEHFIRHGNYLTHVTIVTDPVYLAEPLIKSQDFLFDPNFRGNWIWPCEYVDEVMNRPKDSIPNYLPGQNAFLKEFTDRYNLSPAAALGGPETMYPEYRKQVKPPVSAVTAKLARAQTQNPETAEVHVLPVQGNVYMVVGAGSNIAAQLGPQGVLLVDTQLAPLSDKILAEIAKVSGKRLRYIINTSADADHTGGNENLRKAGAMVFAGPGAGAINNAAEGAAVFAHINVLNRMSAPTGTKSPTPSSAWPTDTYAGDVKELFFNGESIQTLHQPAAHTDGDSLVYFRRSDVIAAGDLFVTTSFPVIDLERGGSLQGEIEALNRLLDMMIPEHEQEGGTMVIPGHGRVCDEADVVEYRDMVVIIRDRIRAMIKKGMTLEQVKAARPTSDYDPLYAATQGAWTPEKFVEAAYRSLSQNISQKK